MGFSKVRIVVNWSPICVLSFTVDGVARGKPGPTV